MEEKNLEMNKAVELEEQKNPMELNERELQAVQTLAARIDITDPRHLQKYGAAAREKLASFAEETLAAARGRDLGETGRKIAELMTELKGFDGSELRGGGIFSLFRSTAKKMELIHARYDKIAKGTEKIVESLADYEAGLRRDMEHFDQLRQWNLELYRMFTVYIEAGKQRLRRERETTLASMRVIASRTGLARDNQSVKDFEECCLRFEQKIHDLETTRELCLQVAPRILLLQKTASALADKLLSVLGSAIPLWKSQTVQALGLTQQEPVEAEAAKTAVRVTADMAAVKDANKKLASTLDELLQTRAECTQKRRNAEQELQDMELRLRMKLLEE